MGNCVQESLSRAEGLVEQGRRGIGLDGCCLYATLVALGVEIDAEDLRSRQGHPEMVGEVINREKIKGQKRVAFKGDDSIDLPEIDALANYTKDLGDCEHVGTLLGVRTAGSNLFMDGHVLAWPRRDSLPRDKRKSLTDKRKHLLFDPQHGEVVLDRSEIVPYLLETADRLGLDGAIVLEAHVLGRSKNASDANVVG